MDVEGACCFSPQNSEEGFQIADESDEKLVDFTHFGLTDVPPIVSTCIETLILRRNRLRAFPANDCFCNLVCVDLYDNLLETVPAALLRLQKLQVLDLSFNRLSVVENIPPSVTKLYLACNAITAPFDAQNECMWKQLAPSLKVLELGGNRIHTISPAIAHLTALEELWLGKNCISVVPDVFRGMLQLKIVSFQNNSIERINVRLCASPPIERENVAVEKAASETCVFGVALQELYFAANKLASFSLQIDASTHAQPQLRVLDLADNRLQDVSPFCRDPLPNLADLWLNKNLLQSLEATLAQLGIFAPSLETIYLDENPCQTAAGVNYYRKIRLAFPQIKQIDCNFIA